LSAGNPPAGPTPPATPESTPPADPPKQPEPGPETEPAEGDGDKEPEGAPEQYAFEAPPGVTLDPAAVEEFTPVARELGLTQAQAQRLVGVVAGMQQRQAEAQAEQVRQWAEAVVSDKEIGGANWDANRAVVARARDAFASPELVQLMESTGLGSHPEVIKLFVRVGKAIADDGHVIGGHPGPDPRSAESFYARMAR
jgi:hypothetical protein